MRRNRANHHSYSDTSRYVYLYAISTWAFLSLLALAFTHVHDFSQPTVPNFSLALSNPIFDDFLYCQNPCRPFQNVNLTSASGFLSPAITAEWGKSHKTTFDEGMNRTALEEKIRNLKLDHNGIGPLNSTLTLRTKVEKLISETSQKLAFYAPQSFIFPSGDIHCVPKTTCQIGAQVFPSVYSKGPLGKIPAGKQTAYVSYEFTWGGDVVLRFPDRCALGANSASCLFQPGSSIGSVRNLFNQTVGLVGKSLASLNVSVVSHMPEYKNGKTLTNIKTDIRGDLKESAVILRTNHYTSYSDPYWVWITWFPQTLLTSMRKTPEVLSAFFLFPFYNWFKGDCPFDALPKGYRRLNDQAAGCVFQRVFKNATWAEIGANLAFRSAPGGNMYLPATATLFLCAGTEFCDTSAIASSVSKDISKF